MDLKDKENSFLCIALAGQLIDEKLKPLMIEVSALLNAATGISFKELSEQQKHAVVYASLEFISDSAIKKMAILAADVPGIELAKEQLFAGVEFDPSKILEKLKAVDPARFERTVAASELSDDDLSSIGLTRKPQSGTLNA